MSENLTLGVYVTGAVIIGLILVAIVGITIDRLFSRHER